MTKHLSICTYYSTTGYPVFKPVCKLGLKAGLHCHKLKDYDWCKEHKYYEGD